VEKKGILAFYLVFPKKNQNINFLFLIIHLASSLEMLLPSYQAYRSSQKQVESIYTPALDIPFIEGASAPNVRSISLSYLFSLFLHRNSVFFTV